MTILRFKTSSFKKKKKVSNPTPRSYIKQLAEGTANPFSDFGINTSVYRRQEDDIPSLSSGVGTCAKNEKKQYTGDKILGIGVMHKSNCVPIFNGEQAESISKMRRN